MTVVRQAAASRPGPGYCRPVEASDRGNESKIPAAPAGAAANDELQPLTRSELAPSSYVAAPSGDSGPSGLATRKADSGPRLAGPGRRSDGAGAGGATQPSGSVPLESHGYPTAGPASPSRAAAASDLC